MQCLDISVVLFNCHVCVVSVGGKKTEYEREVSRKEKSLWPARGRTIETLGSTHVRTLGRYM
jgi:hypothetical protein